MATTTTQLTLVAGDTGSTLVFTCKTLQNTVIDLTGATVQFRYQIGTNSVVTNNCTITAATSGVCEYIWSVGELVAGYLNGEVVITDSSFRVTTSAQITAFIRSII